MKQARLLALAAVAAAAGVTVTPASAAHPGCSAGINQTIPITSIGHVHVCSEGVRSVGGGVTSASRIMVTAGTTTVGVCVGRFIIDPSSTTPVVVDRGGIGTTPLYTTATGGCP